MRITNANLFRLALTDLESIGTENARLLRAAGTGRRLTKPSDDPADAVRQLRLHRTISSQNELLDSLRTAHEELDNTELAIDDGISIFQRARELAIQGAMGARSGADFEGIAVEADQLLQDLIAVANRRVDNRQMFAGTATLTTPFQVVGNPPAAVNYVGTSDTRTVNPAPGVAMAVNIPGDEAFLTGNAFQALIDLRDAARAGDVGALSTTVNDGIETAFDSLVNVRTKLGSMTGGLERTIQSLESAGLATQRLLGSIEDVDMVETLVDLQTIENRRLAALQAAARVIQPTILDFLA